MPRTSRDTASNVHDFGVAEDRSTDLGGYTVNFTTIKETHDLAPMLASLPGGMCPCPHWGYVFTGKVIARYGNREESFEAGDAYYMPPGHTAAADAGTELLQISPADQMADVNAAIAAAMGQGRGQ